MWKHFIREGGLIRISVVQITNHGYGLYILHIATNDMWMYFLFFSYNDYDMDIVDTYV